jgi:penicillin-binding protein 1A
VTQVPDAERPPRRRRFRRWLGRGLLALVVVSAIGVLVFEAIVTQVGWHVRQQLGDPTRYRPPTSVQVHDRWGNLVDSFAAERRIWVDLDTLPPHVWRAFLAAEDRKFFRHHGIDPSAIGRAFLANWRAGHVTEGGSTITQQLAKNLVTGNEKSYTRKLHEAVVAHWLERSLSKHDILELYLNFVYLGAGSFGVESAAQHFFGKSARFLDPGQAAMLASVIPAPSRDNPERDPAIAATQRAQVLRSMGQLGWLSPSEVAGYTDDPLMAEPVADTTPHVGDAYRTQLRRELRRLFGEETAFREGMHVVTPYNYAVQAVAEHAVRQATIELQKRQGLGGPIDEIDPSRWDAWLARASGLPHDKSGQPLLPTPGLCFPALVRNGLSELAAGPFTFALAPGDARLIVRAGGLEGGRHVPLAVRAHPGAVIRVCATDTTTKVGKSGETRPVVTYDQGPWAESAAVVLENATGNVVALVGGKQDTLEGLVRATQARRQPGSTFKPYVYATALSNGDSQLDTILDAPVCLPMGNGGMWCPHNYNGGFMGPMPYRRALALSRNLPSVRLALKHGPHAIAETARRMGVTSPLREDLTIALGSSELTPMEQAVGMCTIARMGSRPDPVFILEVRDREDHVLGRAGEEAVLSDGRRVRLPGGPGFQALDPGVAYELSDMLRDVVIEGTARRAYRPDQVRIGKTGTTNDATDVWFMGATPEYTAAIWVGTDRPESLGGGETGGRTALPAWITIADSLPPPAQQELTMPSEGVRVPWETIWVGLNRGNVPDKVLHRPAVGPGPLPAFPSPRPSIAQERYAVDTPGPQPTTP